MHLLNFCWISHLLFSLPFSSFHFFFLLSSLLSSLSSLQLLPSPISLYFCSTFAIQFLKAVIEQTVEARQVKHFRWNPKKFHNEKFLHRETACCSANMLVQLLNSNVVNRFSSIPYRKISRKCPLIICLTRWTMVKWLSSCTIYPAPISCD